MNKLWRGLPLVLSCAVLLVFPCLGDEDPVEKRFQSVSVMDVTFAGENGVVVLNASSLTRLSQCTYINAVLCFRSQN